MKRIFRIFYTLTLIFCLGFLMISGEFNASAPSEQATKLRKQHCFGYTIIEAGKGVDCYGDTIKLARPHERYQLVSRLEKPKAPARILN